jgi:hypothetical protein
MKPEAVSFIALLWLQGLVYPPVVGDLPNMKPERRFLHSSALASRFSLSSGCWRPAQYIKKEEATQIISVGDLMLFLSKQ